ncbi:MAG: hypothetical protein Kow00120_29380 [Anaerolineae bacterium]
MHTVEVDQSGRVDETNRATVLALADGMAYSVAISAGDKRECIQALRGRRWGKDPTTLYVLLFATLLYLLLREHAGKLDRVIIDTEYPGHEAIIKGHVLNLFQRSGVRVDPMIFSFQQVGKKSPAHALGARVFRGKAAPDRRLTAAEVLAEFGE